MLAVLISLVLHAGVLAYLIYAPATQHSRPADAPVEVELVELTPELLEAMAPQLAVSEDLRDLASNLDQPRQANANPYRPRSGNMEEQVAEELAQLESETFGALAEGREPQEQRTSAANPEDSADPERYDWYEANNPDEPVTAAWSLSNRELLYGPKPSYVCRYSGVVQVTIEVGQDGKVSKAVLDPNGTTTSQTCLTDKAVAFAQRWIFNSKLSAPKRQAGSITFTFVRQ